MDKATQTAKTKTNPNWLDKNHLGFLNLLVYVFRFHSEAETDEISSLKKGETKETDGLWPRPWLYSRVLLLFLIAFAMLYACWRIEGKAESSALLPGLIIVGALAFPMSALIFFYECNKHRNISLLSVLRYFLIGSCISISVLFVLTYTLDLSMNVWVRLPRWLSRYLELRYGIVRPLYVLDVYPSLAMALTAIFEEFAKTLIIYFFLMKHKSSLRILTGMLIGASVGAGFAVFESAGYAITDSDLLSNILFRGMLSPMCHIAWGALIGGGTMMLAKGELRYSFLFNPKFSLTFLFVCTLHFAWNYLLDTRYTLTQNIQLGAFTWFLLLLMMWMGIRTGTKQSSSVRQRRKTAHCLWVSTPLYLPYILDLTAKITLLYMLDMEKANKERQNKRRHIHIYLLSHVFLFLAFLFHKL